MNPSVHTDDARFLELLERWLSGDFTRSDEQELHALASADDFRREAWEGFSAMPDSQHELQLERLRRRLHGNPGGRRLPLGMWMAAAAAVVLLIGAIFFFPRFQADRSTAPLAKTEEQPTAQTQDLSDAGVESESGLVASAPETNPVPPGAKSGLNQRDEIAQKALPGPSAPQKSDRPAKATSPPPADVAPVATAPPPAGNTAAKPRPVEVLEDKLASVSDSEQPTTRAVPDSVGLTVLNTRKENAGAAPAAKKTDATLAAPNGGWDDFHAFLRRTARLPAEARNNNISGNVRLEFTVGIDGKPANVRVVRALGHGCDEEAMRLIRLFDWSPPGTSPVVVEVPFVR
ncbi:MAG: TonB family protein [Lewinellaceae bacterium]|nr:TonB family protein [Saprospiraceae bacterium]MCB9329915.1 TonB family protein [Lewinellaceae bacterium]